MKDNMMKYFKLLMLIITLLPNVGYTYETPNTPYVDELRKMRGILIKSQLCVEKKYLSWWVYEEIMWKYYEGIDQLTSIHKEDIRKTEVLVNWEYYKRGYREEISFFISPVSCEDVREELVKHTLFVRHFN
jgi:hypothetical protein